MNLLKAAFSELPRGQPMDSIRHNIEIISDSTFRNANSKKKSIDLLPPNIILSIVSKVIPPKKVIRLNLPHRPSDLSVCLIVKDNNKHDYNKSTDSWKRRWNYDSKNSALSVNPPSVSFLPLRELKLAYQTFASKRRLAATFDLFLSDRRIVHHLPSKLGKAFYGECCGKMPIPISVTNCNLVDQVANELNTVLFVIRGKGVTDALPLGNTGLPASKLKENIVAACEKICDEWPGGGLDNIRSIYIQSSGLSIPIYQDVSEAPISTLCDSVSTLPYGHKRRSENLLKKLEHLDPISLEETTLPSTDQQKSRKLFKRLPLSLISKVADDLPLPPGGIPAALSSRKKDMSKGKLKRPIKSKVKKVK